MGEEDPPLPGVRYPPHGRLHKKARILERAANEADLLPALFSLPPPLQKCQRVPKSPYRTILNEPRYHLRGKRSRGETMPEDASS